MSGKLSSEQGFYLYLVKQIIFYPVAQTLCCKMLCCKSLCVCCRLAKTLSMYFTLPSVVRVLWNMNWRRCWKLTYEILVFMLMWLLASFLHFRLMHIHPFSHMLYNLPQVFSWIHIWRQESNTEVHAQCSSIHPSIQQIYSLYTHGHGELELIAADTRQVANLSQGQHETTRIHSCSHLRAISFTSSTDVHVYRLWARVNEIVWDNWVQFGKLTHHCLPLWPLQKLIIVWLWN